VAPTHLAIRRAKGVHGLGVDAHPIPDRHEYARGKDWRRPAVHGRMQQSCRAPQRALPWRLFARHISATEATLLISGDNNPLNRDLDRSGEPTQRVRVRDPPRPPGFRSS